MRVFVNQRDYSVAFLDISGTGPAPQYEDTDGVFHVDVSESCLENIEEEHYADLFYDPEQNIVYRDPNLITFKTQVGKDWLTAKLQNYSLIPPEARSTDFDNLKDVATTYLGLERVEEILSDDALSDEDVANILSYITGDEDTDETP